MLFKLLFQCLFAGALCTTDCITDMEISYQQIHYYINGNYEDEVYLNEYTLTNHTDKSYFTFVNYELPVDPHNRERVLKTFFFINYKDFSLLSLVFDNFYKIGDAFLVGKFFFKEIKPGKSFRYILMKRDSTKPSFQNNIWYFPTSVFYDYLGIYPSKCPEELIYKLDYIVL